MGIKQRFTKFVMKRVAIPQVEKIIEAEKRISTLEDALVADENSPGRFEIVLEALNQTRTDATLPVANVKLTRTFRSIMLNMKKSLKSIIDNPISPRENISVEELSELEVYANKLGVFALGYTKLPTNLIFRERGVLHDNVIVLAMEMDKEKMELAPSFPTEIMIMQTYDALGIVSNKLTTFLRKKGFSAQAGHPLGGITLYPPLAEKAGLGWHGAHGLIITPEFGPRVRLTAIYTNIQNLPLYDENNNPHSWIIDFCNQCKRCIRKCPGWAIYEKPIVHENGLKTHIENEACFPVFLEYHGCSICIKECTFNKVDFQRIKQNFQKTEILTFPEVDKLIEEV
ncbi:MAG: 4Fe-4S dicluster domain-containing protein [Candidatus Hodarchaeales archaeon]|jgi:ferredoxin